MMIALNSRVRKGGKERGKVMEKYGGIWEEEERNADYGGMVQHSQQRVAPCVKGVEWGFGTRGFRMVAVFWAGFQVEVTQEAGVVPRRRHAAIRTHF